MPNSIIKSLAKKHNKSVDEVEDLWDKAKIISKKKTGSTTGQDFFAFTVGVLKKMLKKENLTKDPEFLVEEYLHEGDMETNGTPHKVRAEPKNSSSVIFKRDQFRRRREERDKERRIRQKKNKKHEQEGLIRTGEIKGHSHTYTSGDSITSEDSGHSHGIEYDEVKRVISISPDPEDNHIHSVV